MFRVLVVGTAHGGGTVVGNPKKLAHLLFRMSRQRLASTVLNELADDGGGYTSPRKSIFSQQSH
jgi:hypothetical protein